MIKEEIEKVSDKHVHCDGNGDGLGHPKVYLEIGEEGQVVCPYCSKKFVYSSHLKN